MSWHVREAVDSDACNIAQVFSPARRSLSFLPELYTVEEDRWFIQHVILPECRVWVAEDIGIWGFLALDAFEVRLLYVHPDRTGSGAEQLLVETAQQASDSLNLWCFSANVRAQRFY